ncbi:MAG: bifunctional metallophosphatase/5'-nucleotidase, partial [Nitrososphaerales archaeon]
YVELHQELFWTAAGATYRKAGGYARIATLLKQIRAERPGAVLALDNGDTIHGTYPAVETRGEALVPLLNALGFAAMTAHWEFAYGPAQLRKVAGELRYPLLATNVYDKATGEHAFESRRIYEVAGLRVGVAGIASNIVDKTMPPHFSEGLRFTLGKNELAEAVARLREQEHVDLVVVLSHLGFPQDMQLAEDVSGVDVLLGSHTHNRLYRPVIVGRTVLIQSGSHGSFLGRLDVSVDGGRVTGVDHRLITVGEEIAPDPAMQALVDDVMRPYRAELERVVGRTATALNRNTMLESTMDNFLLQSLLEETGAVVAFSNGWRYGAPIPPGPVTMNDLYNIVPMNPPVMTVALTGEELREMLEENLERTLARDPYGQMGGYLKRMAGVKIYAKAENPAGQRIQELYVGDRRIVPAQRYRAAFVTEQGVPARYGAHREDTGVRAVTALERSLARRAAVEAELTGSVVLV